MDMGFFIFLPSGKKLPLDTEDMTFIIVLLQYLGGDAANDRIMG